MSNELFGEVVKTISLDFAQKTSPVTVFAKQGDNRTRIIHIQPLMNGVPMNIDTSFQYVAKFAAKKPDGHYVYNDSAKINEDGTITVTLTDQTLAAHGNAICCIMLETQSGDVLSSQNFTLIIEFSAGAYKDIVSDDEIDDILDKVVKLLDEKIPPIKPEDKDKVLTANEDGTAEWKDPTGGECVTMVVNVSRADGDTYSSDKTIAEILEAYDKGKQIAFDLLDSGYHWIFTDGWIAITNKTPYQGVIQYSNAVMYFTADNTTTENNVDSFKSSMREHNELPEITEDDSGKVLTVGEDGKAGWKEPTVGNANFIFANSKEELPDPSTVPENTVGLVPSEGAGGGTKVINLTQYVFNGGGSFNDVILSMFANGGGSMINETEISTFWEDVNTNNEVKFVVDASALIAGVKIESDEKSRTKNNGQMIAIETSFMVIMETSYRVTVVFGCD